MVVWRYLDGTGSPSGSSEPFDDRAAAEAWLGETWQRLLQDGVEEVVLLEGDRELYRMGLDEA